MILKNRFSNNFFIFISGRNWFFWTTEWFRNCTKFNQLQPLAVESRGFHQMLRNEMVTRRMDSSTSGSSSSSSSSSSSTSSIVVVVVVVVVVVTIRIYVTRCSAIAEKPRCRVRYSFGQKWKTETEPVRIRTDQVKYYRFWAKSIFRQPTHVGLLCKSSGMKYASKTGKF